MSSSLKTKGDLINEALTKIAISGLTAPPEASDTQTALIRLETMMYELAENRNICVGYQFTQVPDPADFHRMNIGHFNGISNLLAVRILKDFEIQPNQTLLSDTRQSINAISNTVFQLREVQYPRRQARGSGNTLRYNRWQRFYRKPDRVPPDCNSLRMDVDEVNDFTENFYSYLRSGETIQTYRIDVTNALVLVASSLNDEGFINYRLRALQQNEDNGVEQVRFIVITSTGRIEERVIGVEVRERDSDRRFPAADEPDEFGFGPLRAGFARGNFNNPNR